MFSRTRQSLICFPLGWEGGDRSNFFSAAPWEKNRPNLGARLETNPHPANLPMGGVSKSDQRARTWRRLNNPSRTRLCKSAGAPPPFLRAALRMHFALGSTTMQTDTHMHARKNSSECLPGREVSSLVQRSTGRPSIRKTPYTRDPLPGAGSNSDKPRGESGHGPLREGGGGAAVAPAAFFVRTTTPQISKAPRQLRPYLPRRRLHDAEGTSILRPPPTAAFKGL